MTESLWSHTYICGTERTLSSAQSPATPHWCEVCERAYSEPCHAHSDCQECARGFARLDVLGGRARAKAWGRAEQLELLGSGAGNAA